MAYGNVCKMQYNYMCKCTIRGALQFCEYDPPRLEPIGSYAFHLGGGVNSYLVTYLDVIVCESVNLSCDDARDVRAKSIVIVLQQQFSSQIDSSLQLALLESVSAVP